MSKLFWHAVPRIVVFWTIVVSVVFLCDLSLDVMDLRYLFETSSNAIHQTSIGDGDSALLAVTQPVFAVSLALALGCLGGALLTAFSVTHWLFVRITLWRLCRTIMKPKNRQAFADAYDNAIYPKLVRHPLFGHAWKEFDETLLKGNRLVDGMIGNTVRPQAFINYGVLREHLGGYKFLGSISGYFVGVGLLLTFGGIVLALYEAGASVSASNVEAMQAAMQKLLQIASFKFSTSIAGLGVSIIFAVVAKFIVISIESGTAKLCEAAEHQMRYVAPQSLAVETNVYSREQLDQLKEMNSDRYFSKFADSISPLLEAAMSKAMVPVTEQIGSAISKLTTTSQSGVGELIEKFSTSVQSGAGAELRQLGETLRDMQASLAQTQATMHGTGEDFTRRISEAAENLNRLVSEAGGKLEGGAESNRLAMQEMIEALRATFEHANSQIDTDLGKAASGAAEKMEAAMGTVLEKLEGQVGGLVTSMQAFQDNSTKGLETTRQQISDAQVQAATVVANVGSEAAQALQSGLAQALERINSEFERFEAAMRSGASAYGQQASAIGDATNQTRQAADAFAQVADSVRGSSTPLLQSSERILQATTELSRSTQQGVADIGHISKEASALSEALRQQSAQQVTHWQQYADRFEGADKSLAAAVTALDKAMSDQGQALNDRIGEMDLELSKVLARLHPLVGDIGEHAEELSEAVSKMTHLHQAAE